MHFYFLRGQMKIMRSNFHFRWKSGGHTFTENNEVKISLKIKGLNFHKNQEAALSRPGQRLVSRARGFFWLPGRRKGDWFCYRMKVMMRNYDQSGGDDDSGDNGYFGEIELVFIMTWLWYGSQLIDNNWRLIDYDDDDCLTDHHFKVGGIRTWHHLCQLPWEHWVLSMSLPISHTDIINFKTYNNRQKLTLWLALVANLATRWPTCISWKFDHQMAPHAFNACGAIWWPNLQLTHVVPSVGQIFN